MSSAVQKLVGFWHRYENLNLKIAFVLISLQLIHLYWLTSDVVIQRITGESILGVPHGSPLFIFFIIIDYVEIPALVAGLTYYTLSIYKHEKGSAKNALLLSMLAIQVFHIFWITDEIVYDAFFETRLVEFPLYVAWIAILIDYLELPVMADLFYKIIKGEKKWR